MKYYIAGKFDDHERVHELIEWVDRIGEVTHDWTLLEPVSDKEVPILDEYRRTALLDFQGIDDCDIVVALMDREYIFRGTWVEVGYALAQGKEVVIIGRANAMRCNFSGHPRVSILDNIDEFKQRTEQLIADGEFTSKYNLVYYYG
jgi:nucleoside 2-deoxyribosyltransferase